MPNRMRILTITLFAVLALLLAACGGASGSSNDSTDDDDGAPKKAADGVFGDFGDDELYVSNGIEVLAASAEQFDQQITSMEGNFEIAIAGGGASLTIDADYAFASPGAMYLSMTMDGIDEMGVDLGAFGAMDMLVRDDALYMKTPIFGPQWIKMSFADLGSDVAELENMLADASAFDYTSLVDGVDGAEFVGEETIDGRALLHYRVTVDAADAIGSFKDALDSSGDFTDTYADVSGPVSMDLWVGKSDFLPYLLTIDADLNSASEGSISMEMTMTVTGYNTDVSIPPAPTDAISMEEVFGDLFDDLTEDDGWDDFLGSGS